MCVCLRERERERERHTHTNTHTHTHTKDNEGEDTLLTNAGLAVGVEGVFLMAATHGPRVSVITRVLAASVSIVARY